MSADYKIENPTYNTKLIVTCYHCGKPMNPNSLLTGHEECVKDDPYDRLKLDIEIQE